VESSPPSEPAPRPRISDEEAARLVDTYEPTTLVAAILNAAQKCGWPAFIVGMQTDDGSVCTIKNGKLSANSYDAVRDALGKRSTAHLVRVRDVEAE